MSFIITGSVAYDYLMRFPGRFRDQILPDQLDKLSVSFLADSMRRARGGVAANIAYTMRLLGGAPVILATVGEDFGDYRRWLEAEGLSTEQIIEIADELTATFFVSTDIEQNQIANFYAGAMGHARHHTLASRNLTGASMVVISPNDPLAMLTYAQECKEHGIPFAYDPSQQIARLSGEELRRSIPGAAYLLCNEYELAMVQNKTGWSLEELRRQVETLVLTLGKDGSLIFHREETDEQEIPVPAATLARLEDPTGAGDAYRGGFFAARMAGLPLAVAGRVGALCSAYALEHMGTTTHRFTVDEFIQRYTAEFGPEPALEALRQPAQVR
ncbi:MAG TPA: carbohydrate kinase family protein [Caldilineaceae bacterium]|nr:carbohydrate kinase family protein [Caldilineaceae bacterium]